jgi:uridine phosphorylase
MKEREFPIIEFDPSAEAVINPAPGKDGFCLPERAVLCFPQKVIDTLAADGCHEPCHHLGSSMGRHPIYAVEAFGTTIAVLQPGLGASFAGAFLDEIIALGVRKVISCGLCGVLDRDMPRGMVVVPTSAVRDEGTSYHYMPPSREVGPTPEVIPMIEDVLKAHDCRYVLGKTWTTDAFYRETHARVKCRREEGCLTVEMEAAAMFAVARFRGIQIGMLLGCGDDVSGEVWDERHDHPALTADDKLFWLAMEACSRL